MTRLALLSTVLILAACSGDVPEDRPTPEGVAEAPAPAPLEFIAPDTSEVDYHSPVAPYVFARGAGPSRLSPDGRTVATRLSLTGTRQLYVMDAEAIDPKSTLKMLSQGSGITFFEFSPTGALIYGADNNGDERENYWMVEPDEEGEWSAPRLLLPATAQGFRSFGDFTGDGRTIVYASTERNGLDYDIYTADVETGETRLVFEGEYGNFVQAVAPDGSTAIVSESVGEDSDRLFVLDLPTGERTVLSDPTPRANHTDAGVGYMSDAAILFATNRFGEFTALTRLILERGIQSASFTLNQGKDVDGFGFCEGNILYTLNGDGFSETRAMVGNRSEVRVEGLPDGVHQVSCEGDTALVRVSAPNIPGDLYLMELDALEPRRIFASDYGSLDPDALILPEPVRMPARDGVELQGLLYLPEGADRPPVLFDVHGGPTAQSRPVWNGTVQYLLSRGIAVFQPNMRGSTGFGRTYVTLDDRRKRLDSVRDLVDMLDWLEADGRVDTSRAAVRGGSYGGYMVNAVLADYPDAFDAGVALFGVGDWVTALEVASPALKASDRIEYGDISDPDWRAFYEEISPIAKADNIRVPVLYSHGVMDPRIDVAETEVMVRALRENGVRADYIRIPDEGHGWRKLANRLWYAEREADFLNEVFGD
ncbi:MAG: S9 family peptidase [Litorimonas sp.]